MALPLRKKTFFCGFPYFVIGLLQIAFIKMSKSFFKFSIGRWSSLLEHQPGMPGLVLVVVVVDPADVDPSILTLHQQQPR